MIVRTLSVFAIGALALAPIAASAAATPSPETMRAALADPIDKSFIEADIGAAGTLEGPFDADSYGKYFELSGTDESTAQSLVRSLHSNGFVGGYGRQWYQPRGALEYLGELIMVFNNSSGASSIALASKMRYQQDRGFQSLVEPRLSKGSFGVTESSGGYSWTIVIFQKGSNLFAVARGSDVSNRTDEALAQARRAYAVAPSSVGGLAAPDQRAGMSQSFRLLAVVGLMLLLAVATLVAVIVLVPRARVKP